MGKENIYRYPIAPHLHSHWTRAERSGVFELPVGDSGSVLRIDYVQYKPPEYFLGRHFLGAVTLDGQPIRVIERYRYHTVNNSGSVKWKGEATSLEGECACSEIIMAHEAGKPLSLQPVEAGIWQLVVAHKVDQSFHEIEFDSFRCDGRLDTVQRELTLDRSFYRDAST